MSLLVSVEDVQKERFVIIENEQYSVINPSWEDENQRKCCTHGTERSQDPSRE